MVEKKMIEKLLLRNFQCHERFELEFDPFLTTITGKTDSGKSAIFRGLKWLTSNHPSGETFIRQGSSRTTVRLWVDGHEIVRQRGDKRNVYALDGNKYLSFGQGVPEDIQKILNLSEVSFSSQLDSPFLFCKSSAEVSRELNIVVSLDLIDQTLSNLASEKRRAKAEVEIVESRYREAKAARDRLAWVTEADQALIELEKLEASLVETDEKRDKFIRLVQDIQNSEKGFQEVSKDLEWGLTRISQVEVYLDISRKIERLTNLVGTIQKTQQIANQEIPVRELEMVDNLQHKANTLDGEYRRLTELVKKIHIEEAELWKLENELAKVEKLLQERFGKRCPTCGQQVLT
ncbi:MAG: AAA family ATPase [Patescibacteria group bacterium]|nr:AAA family ATPase [Patescibacteria group bacterium]